LFEFDNHADCVEEALSVAPEACADTLRECTRATFYDPGDVDHNCENDSFTDQQIDTCPATLDQISDCMRGISEQSRSLVVSFGCGSGTTIDQIQAARDPIAASATVPACAAVPVECLETILSL
jgi:hypothetical protein